MKDYICVISCSKLNAGLRKLGLKNGEGKFDLGLPTIDSPDFVMDGKTFHFSVVRCMEQEDKTKIADLAGIPCLEILGEVVGSMFVWKDEVSQDLYEKCMEVGQYRKSVPKLSKDGQLMLDENLDLIKVKTSHAYRFGVFC